MHPRLRQLIVSGLIVAIVPVSLLAVAFIGHDRGYVSESWPKGQTVLIRDQIEEMLPPPPDTEMVNVRYFGGAADIPYREVIYYRSQLTPSQILGYYRDPLQRRAWLITEYPDNSLVATDRAIPPVTPTQVPSPNSTGSAPDGSQVEPRDSAAEVDVYFYPTGSGFEHEPFTYGLSSPSLQRAAEAMRSR